MQNHRFRDFDWRACGYRCARSCADSHLPRIFSAHDYMVADHVERLPEKLPLLYAGVAH